MKRDDETTTEFWIRRIREDAQEPLIKALEAMLTDPPTTLDEPDANAEVIIKMRAIARAALAAARAEA